MEAYWHYMDANQQQLRRSADQLQDSLDERIRERDHLKLELQELLQETDDRPIATMENRRIESHFKERMKELEENEQYLTRLQEVVMNATNCIAKIAHSLDDTKGDVTPETVSEAMEFCGSKMVAMLVAREKMIQSEEMPRDMGSSWSGMMTRSDLSASQL